MADSNKEESSTTTPPPPPPQARGFQALSVHITQNRIDVALWASRVISIIFAVLYIIPILGNPQTSYYKVILANAATSALRLHQRIPTVTFSREFLSKLLLEDSCHYLLYSLIFLYVGPQALILFPIVLFAVLHSASYSLTLLDTLGQNSWWGARLLISIVEFQTGNILRLASFSEIFLMPIIIIQVFTGGAGLMTPFLYYHFLVLRYSSRRNPYTRNMFRELRLGTEIIANNERVPLFGRKILHGGINLISRLAPTPQPAQ